MNQKFYCGLMDGRYNLGNRNKFKEGSCNFKEYQKGYEKGCLEYQEKQKEKLEATKRLIKKHPCLYDFIKYAKENSIDFLARNITINDFDGCHCIHEYQIKNIYDFWDEL